MARDPRATVEASLAVARRPTTGQGEREAAIRAADRLIAVHGLDPDAFDIPGRTKGAPRPQPGGDLFGSRTAYEDAFRSFEAALRGFSGVTSQAAAQMGAVQRERERRARPAHEETIRALRADAAVSFLWHYGISVRQAPGDPKTGARRWAITDLHVMLFSDEGVIEVAQAYGFRGQA